MRYGLAAVSWSIFKASSNDGGIEAVFATLARQRPDALIVGADPFFNSRREQFATLAMRNSIPAIYVWREFVVAGGLMSYGDDFADGYRQVGISVGRILKGANPGDLPVMRPSKFELVINRKTAKALGLNVPDKHCAAEFQCPLLGVKRTFAGASICGRQ